MTVKDKIIKAVNELPPQTTVEEAMDRLYLLSKIEKGIAQADRGRTASHAQVKRRVRKWFK